MALEHSHHPIDISRRLDDGPKASYLREWVFGGIDGVVTTFAVIAAVIGAEMETIVILIIGLANLVGDGFSMAAASFSAAKAEKDNYDRLRVMEQKHIEKYRNGEIEETRQILLKKGYRDDELETMIGLVTSDDQRWIDFMMTEEHGLSDPLSTPGKVAFHTFLSFVVCGSMCLWPFVLSLPHAAMISLILTGLTFFGIGSLKSLFSVKSWWQEGLVTLGIGMAAACMTYLVGMLIAMWTGI